MHCEYGVNEMIGGYRVCGHLGDGTFGRVLEGVDSNNHHWAIKVIKPVKRYIKSA